MILQAATGNATGGHVNSFAGQPQPNAAILSPACMCSSYQLCQLSAAALAFTLDVELRSISGNEHIMNPAKRTEIFRRLRAANAEPKSELEYRSPFELLVAVVLSAQATDKSVNLATRELYKAANTPQAILTLGADGLEEFIKRIGLYRTKAKNILATCKLLMERHGGAVPQTREALEQLPGVGRKTANVILNIAFGQPTIAVDTHIFRVANRTGIAPGRRRAGGRGETAQVRAGRIQAARAPLADPARPLRLQGAQSGMPVVPDLRSVRIPRQDKETGATESKKKPD